MDLEKGVNGCWEGIRKFGGNICWFGVFLMWFGGGMCGYGVGCNA
jgi:hypothetical protein